MSELISLQQLSVRFKNGFTLSQINWQLQHGQHWAVTGANGAGKSALATLLTAFDEQRQGIRVVAGSKSSQLSKIGVVSATELQQLLEQERLRFDRGQLDDSRQGSSVAELLQSGQAEPALLSQLVQQFAMEKLLSRPFRLLSTGELRKLLLIRALSCRPQLLILDEPFAGLDKTATAELQQLLAQWQATCTMVFVCGQLDDIPAFVTDLAYMVKGELVLTASCTKTQLAGLRQLMQMSLAGLTLPVSEPQVAALPPDQPLVVMRQVVIRYDDAPLFRPLDWTIMPGQHWQLSGPNGSGKSSLLALITGDHPQCYTNNLRVFGFQRGNGESIWQIKQHIGYVSSALQQEYRSRSNVRDTLLSGFYDSIGLYQQPTAGQLQITAQWLALLAMESRQYESFADLSFGDQRLILIARAMIKRPALLILDEPCLGLDELNRRKVLALTELICRQGSSTVLYVNHQPAEQISGISHYLDLAAYRP